MFIGRYYHRIETKGRVALPKAFRSQEDNWIATRGLDGGIFLLPATTFENQVAEIATRTLTKKQDRDFVRYLTNDAYELDIDGNGRVLLPEYLRSFASLEKDVVVVGSYSYIEIWNQELYHQYLHNLEQSASDLAEQVTL